MSTSHCTGELIESPREPCSGGGLLDAPTPAAVVERGVGVANLLADILRQQRLFSVIRGKKYVHAEGWCVLGAMLGIMPREVSVAEDEAGNVYGTVELVRTTDLGVIGRASAMVGVDEPDWQKRPRFQRRSMAVTRATAKAFRLSLAWVVRLAGYEPQPSEEFDSGSSAVVGEVIAPASSVAATTSTPVTDATVEVVTSTAGAGVRIDMSDEGLREVDDRAPSTEQQHYTIKQLCRNAGLSRDDAQRLLVDHGGQKLAELTIREADVMIQHLRNQAMETDSPF